MGRVLDPVIVVSLVVLTIALAVIVLVPVDISPLRDVTRDSLFLDAARTPPPPVRFRDPSPHRIWLGSDLFVWDSIRSGSLPLWDRMQGGGYSPVVSLQNGVFHPLRWLVAIFPRSAAPSSLIVIALWFAFGGMYLLMRRGVGTSVPAALLGALAFASGPATMSMALFSGALLPVVHLPWTVWLSLRTLERRTFASSVPLIFVLALTIIAGHPLLIFASFLGLCGVAVGFSISRRSAYPIAIFATSVVAASSAAAFAWLPTVMAYDDLWTYKASRTGFGYGYYTFTGWVNVLRSVFFDRSGTSMIDEPPSFGYVGLAASLLVLAGVGLMRKEPGTRIFASLLLLFFLLTMPGPWMAPLSGVPPIGWLKPWYYSVVFGFFLAMLAAIGVEGLWRSRRLARVAGVALAVIATLIYVARAHRVLSPHTQNVSIESEAYRFLRADSERFRITGLWGETHLPNISRLTGIEDVRYSAPLMTLRYHLWWLLIDPQILRHTYPTTRITDRLEHSLIDDFNVKYVLQSRLPFRDSIFTVTDPGLRDTTLSKRLSDVRFPIAFRSPSIEIRLNRGYRPRAHFASQVTGVDSPLAATEAIQKSGAALGAVVEAETELQVGTTGTAGVSYPADSRVTIDVESQTGGLVVLHDTFADGWTTTVDGADAAVLPVNLLSRGVVVPPGRHRIEMTYSPPGFRAGVGLAIVTLLVIALAILRERKRGDGLQPVPERAEAHVS